MKREIFATACAGVVALIAVGFSGTAAAAPGTLVPPSQLDSIVLPADDVSSIVGAALGNRQTSRAPESPEDVDKRECTELFGLDSDGFGADFDAFKAVSLHDGKGDDIYHIVVQSVAIYQDAKTPAQLFHDAFQSVSSCDVIHIKSQPDRVSWQVKIKKVTGSAAQWVTAVLVGGRQNSWRCGHDARVQNNVLLDVQLCQFGNPLAVTTQLADRMTASFSASAS